jgi:hypothetical protein
MQEHDLFRIFISRLNSLEVRYIITGAVASTIYGEPRLTHDLDLVKESRKAHWRKNGGKSRNFTRFHN